jgi:serine/threonine protein kinase
VIEPLPEQDPQSLVGNVVAERYQVDQLLGAGAMGRVYRARHVHMQKQVALKVLHRDTSENAEIVTRFEREAVAAGRINHPNVAGATDFGRLADGSFYLVLEYVQGQSLGALLDEAGALPVPRALGIATQILAALSAAHRADIVHRDLKPDNVMLLDTSEQPPASSLQGATSPADFVKVLDFGLAKLQRTDPADTQLTMAGAIYGTPQYMSPEQAAGAEVDQRADLYAVGVMLFEMLAGQPPFQAEQMMPLLIKHMTEEPPPLPDSVPRSVRRIVTRLLEKEPGRRFQTADDVLVALNEAAPPQPGVAQKSSPALDLSRLPSMPEVKNQLDRIRTKTMSASRPALRYLSREVEIKGHFVPLWLPAGIVAATLLGALVVITLSTGGDEAKMHAMAKPASPVDDEAEPPTSAPSKTVDAKLMAVIEAAKVGSDPALYALENREDAARSDVEWMALTQAYLMRKEVDKGLRAFGFALVENKEHRADKAIIGALRYLADDERYAKAILVFVAERLPDVSADFLFDVWSKTSAKTTATEEAKRLLDSSGVKSNYSEALRLAFDIRDAEDCDDQMDLLPKIIMRGDDRTLSRLRDMRKDPACAKAAGKNLDEAINQAGMRKAPRFPILRRWRWKGGGAPPPSGEGSGEGEGESKKKFPFF